MYESLRNYLFDKVSLSDKELERMESFAVMSHIRKRQFLLKEGEVSQHYSFVMKGCVRLFRISEDDSEHIIRFAAENWWVCDRESLISEKPAKNNIEALEDSVILQWKKSDFEMLQSEIPALKVFFDSLLDRYLIASINRIYDNISLTAEEKYMLFRKNYPDFFNRVPLHMIASYLGVARETLSRIRLQSTLQSDRLNDV